MVELVGDSETWECSCCGDGVTSRSFVHVHNEAANLCDWLCIECWRLTARLAIAHGLALRTEAGLKGLVCPDGP